METTQVNQQKLVNKIDQIKINNENSSEGLSSNNDNINDLDDFITNKNSTKTENINIKENNNDQIPLSALSLTTSSSAASSIHNFVNPANVSTTHIKQYSSNISPLESRRSSDNSIKIRIINSDNAHFNLEKDDLEKCDNDRDDAEDDTTSNSASQELGHTNSKKKLKERKKLVRSIAQQQHHLNAQESEDLLDENLLRDKETRVNNQLYSVAQTNMNSAFDELFAAAQAGNIAKTAVIEAKMAAAAAEINTEYNENGEILGRKRNSIIRSKNGSFRNGSSFKLKTHSNNHDNEISVENSPKAQNSNLGIDNYLGSPSQLTRSCSCKRPGSFKKMRSRNTSPNTTCNDSNNLTITNNSPYSSLRHSPIAIYCNQNFTQSNGRRGTDCSITIMDNFENGMQSNRTGSLPFDKINGDDHTDDNNCINNSDVYRVRQFNTTNTGSVINRGDSFKRSFKRSTHSIASNSNFKKETSNNFHDTNTLNLPDFQEGYLSGKLSSNINSINETSFNGGLDELTYLKDLSVNDNANNQVFEDQKFKSGELLNQDSFDTYLVLMLGSSNVGKNALIKQFYTSEYRGTYEITQYTQTGNTFSIMK